jgi:hypothetical protein
VAGGEKGRRRGGGGRERRDQKSIGRFIRFIADDASNLHRGG